MLLRAPLFTLLSVVLLAPAARADLEPGTLFDFEDGTLQGWSSPAENTSNVPSGGPMGVDDAFLQIDPGTGDHLAAFNTDLAGTIDPAATDIEIDMMRSVGEGTLEVRLVLFGPTTDERFTSTVAQAVPDDGVWRSYTYSILEADLSQVSANGTYAALHAGLARVMFRHQTGAPSALGTSGAGGSLDVDNIFVVPEPAGPLAGTVALATLALVRRRASETGH